MRRLPTRVPDGAVGVGSATLGPGLGGLWGFADPLAKRLLIRQLVILGLLRIAPLRRLVPESILEPPPSAEWTQAMWIRNRWVCHFGRRHGHQT